MTETESMRAVAWRRYGAPDVLALTNQPRPSPGPDELLIKVHASTVTAGDVRLRALNVPRGFGILTRLAFGFRRPRKTIPGMEFAGEVTAIGADVAEFSVGDRVFGTTGMAFGAHAQYLCVPQSGTVIKTADQLTDVDAVAIIFGGQTALHFLRDKVGLEAGQSILINGASGAVGTSAVQLGRHFGATVSGVCSTANIELVKSLGASHVIDYTKGELEQLDQPFDVILDTQGNLPLALCKRWLKPDGKIVNISGGMSTYWRALFDRQLIVGVAGESQAHLAFLQTLALNGELRSVIDQTFDLSDIVAAHRYVDSGRKRGSVVISITH